MSSSTPSHLEMPHSVGTTIWQFGPSEYRDVSYHGCTQPQVVLAGVLRFVKPGDLVVDPMCGSGTAAIALAYHGIRTVNLDISANAIQIAKARAANRGLTRYASFSLADARRLPLASSTASFAFFHPPYYDMVRYAAENGSSPEKDLSMCASYDEFLESIRHVIAEISRVLLPSGGCCLQIGDRLSRGEYLPVGHDLYNLFRLEGFSLFEENVKLPPCQALDAIGRSKRWRDRQNFLGRQQLRNLIQHDYVMIFMKSRTPLRTWVFAP